MDLSVTIEILGARNLISADKNGLSDPYVKYTFKKIKGKTAKIKKTLNPEWANESFSFRMSEEEAFNLPIMFKVIDWDRIGKDDPLGTCSFYVGSGQLPGVHEEYIVLEGVEHGELFIRCTVEKKEVDVLEGELKFFRNVKQGVGVNIERDYVLIVDKSYSMGSGPGSRWEEAKIAVQHLAPFVVEADPDGIDLYFFSSASNLKKYSGINSAHAVDRCWSKQKPDGSTDLTHALGRAISSHFKKGTYTTILVITDGSPDDRRSLEKLIVKASNRLNADEELSISFIQIGNDAGAENFLKKLDDDLDCTFDIVDTISCSDMKGMSFEDFINASIND